MIQHWWKILGPGLLYAGAAVGVSHLVQSTKAGGLYGLDLLIVIVLANIIKYPFFEFAPRYAASTGKSLLHGYEQLGKWSVYLYLGLTVLTMFTIQAAVTIVTASIASSIFQFDISIINWVLLLLGICFGLIVIGKYGFLDNLMKVIIITLSIATVIAVYFAFQQTSYFDLDNTQGFTFEGQHIVFLIALIGWMPAPFDITVWHSLWTKEKFNGIGSEENLKRSLTDFHVGYWGTTLLAAMFLLLGAFTMFGTGEAFSPKGTIFANQVIEMYTQNIGAWSKPLIAIAALATMFSTTLTCYDAFPRVLPPLSRIIIPKLNLSDQKLKIASLVLVGSGAIILLKFFISEMGNMITIATVLSFVTAPIIAFLNYKVVNSNNTPEFARPNQGLKLFSLFGIICLSLFSLWFIAFKLTA